MANSKTFKIREGRALTVRELAAKFDVPTSELARVSKLLDDERSSAVRARRTSGSRKSSSREIHTGRRSSAPHKTVTKRSK